MRDARHLDLAAASVDAALLLGPLYHLYALEDRIASLTELHRVLRPGGVAFAAAISRWSARLYGVLLDRVYKRFPHALDAVTDVERTGVMPPLSPGEFSAYLHRPEDLRHELEVAGFEVLSVVAIEGPAAFLGDVDERLGDQHQRDVLFSTIRAIEAVPELMGDSPHLLAVGRRPA